MGRWFDDDLTGSDLIHLMGYRERMKRMFDEQAASLGEARVNGQAGWSPPVDIDDASDRYLIFAEIPGVDEDAIDLEVVGDSLVLAGERIPNTTEKVICYHRIERPEGPFRRVFRLPDEVDASGIRAEYRDGILKVELPKVAAEGGKRVTVKVE